jgi:hypothetical protein
VYFGAVYSGDELADTPEPRAITVLPPEPSKPVNPIDAAPEIPYSSSPAAQEKIDAKVAVQEPFDQTVIPASERPARPPYATKEEFYVLVAKWLPRYRSASSPKEVNDFAVRASLQRAGIEAMSDPRAWPHLCMRNDAEGGKTA